MGIPLSTLEAAVRSQTDRISDPAVTADEIASFLSDGGRALVDIFNESAPHWLQAKNDFTLAGDTFDTSVADLPEDFELDLGLDWLDAPGATGPVTVRRLPSFQDRNAYGNVNPLLPMNNIYARNYEAQGDELRVYAPQQQTSGSYRLWYTRRFQEMAPSVDDVPIVIDVSDGLETRTVDGVDYLTFVFGAGGLVVGVTSGSLTVNYDTPNDVYNGTYAIKEIIDEFHIVTTQPFTGTPPFTNPAAGTASYSYQPVGTVSVLPNVWTQFRLFIITHAAISVRMKFEEQIGELETRLGQEAQRCKRMAERRDSGLAQIPIIGRGAYDNVAFDTGGFGWED